MRPGPPYATLRPLRPVLGRVLVTARGGAAGLSAGPGEYLSPLGTGWPPQPFGPRTHIHPKDENAYSP